MEIYSCYTGYNYIEHYSTGVDTDFFCCRRVTNCRVLLSQWKTVVVLGMATTVSRIRSLPLVKHVTVFNVSSISSGTAFELCEQASDANLQTLILSSLNFNPS
jgi:hypothetical protein